MQGGGSQQQVQMPGQGYAQPYQQGGQQGYAQPYTQAYSPFSAAAYRPTTQPISSGFTQFTQAQQSAPQNFGLPQINQTAGLPAQGAAMPQATLPTPAAPVATPASQVTVTAMGPARNGVNEYTLSNGTKVTRATGSPLAIGSVYG